MTPEIAASLGIKDAKGALVAEVMPNGPAAKAGFQQGDIVTLHQWPGVEDSRDLTRKVALVPSGQTATFTVDRQGKVRRSRPISATVRTTRWRPMRPNGPAAPPATGNAMGLGLASLTPEARKTFNLAEGTAGVLITKVDPNSDAADKGLQAGDVVQKIGGAR